MEKHFHRRHELRRLTVSHRQAGPGCLSRAAKPEEPNMDPGRSDAAPPDSGAPPSRPHVFPAARDEGGNTASAHDEMLTRALELRQALERLLRESTALIAKAKQLMELTEEKAKLHAEQDQK
jgi:hypothetical protein